MQMEGFLSSTTHDPLSVFCRHYRGCKETRLLAVSHGNTTTKETSSAENRTQKFQFELFFSSGLLSHFLSLTFFWEGSSEKPKLAKLQNVWNFTFSKYFRIWRSAHENRERVAIPFDLLQQKPTCTHLLPHHVKIIFTTSFIISMNYHLQSKKWRQRNL